MQITQKQIKSIEMYYEFFFGKSLFDFEINPDLMIQPEFPSGEDTSSNIFKSRQLLSLNIQKYY